MIDFDDSTLYKNMCSISIPFPHPFKMITISTPLICAPKLAHNSISRTKFCNANMSFGSSQVMLSHRASFTGNGVIRMGHTAVACGTKDPAPQEEHGALETVLKLYEAIKNKNVYELSDIIAEECLCVSNFVSAFQPCQGKQQVLAFFSSLMKNLGNNMEFVVQQTLDDGMVVGISWKLEWNKVPLNLGKGFSFYMCHVYQGKVMIKNVEIFMEPLLHIEPLRMVVIKIVTTAMEKMNPQALFKNKAKRAITILFIILFIAAIVFLLKYRVST